MHFPWIISRIMLTIDLPLLWGTLTIKKACCLKFQNKFPLSPYMFLAAGLTLQFLSTPTVLLVSFELLLKSRNVPTWKVALHCRGDKWSSSAGHSHDTEIVGYNLEWKMPPQSQSFLLHWVMRRGKTWIKVLFSQKWAFSVSVKIKDPGCVRLDLYWLQKLG